jgi:hypothetical protein
LIPRGIWFSDGPWRKSASKKTVIEQETIRFNVGLTGSDSAAGKQENVMRRAIGGILAGATLALASTSANAAITLAIDSPGLNTGGSSAFAGKVTGTGSAASFTDDFFFNLTNADLLDGHVDTLQIAGGLLDIDFSSIYIDTIANAFTQTSFDPNTETWQLVPGVNLGAGDHHLFVSGNYNTPVGSNPTYTGTLNITAVPEPATWGLMLLGFAGVGMALGRRRRPALAQLA